MYDTHFSYNSLENKKHVSFPEIDRHFPKVNCHFPAKVDIFLQK